MHIRLVKISPKVYRVRRPNILGYRVEHIQRWKLASRRCLRHVSIVVTWLTSPRGSWTESDSETGRRGHTRLMWLIKTREMASACSTFSLAIRVKLEI